MIENIYEKVRNGQRITESEARELFYKADLMKLGELASLCCMRKVESDGYYQYNYNINYTNICENKCKFCAFYRDNNEGYTLSVEEILVKVRKAYACGVNEVHIVGGLNKNLPFSYYLELMRGIKEIDSIITIQAFTAVEIDFFSNLYGLSTFDILQQLQKAGLTTLPGGGAEIFAPSVRSQICEKKVCAEVWLRVHKEAHMLGMATNATMLYNHVETIDDIIDHLSKLRNLQDITGGFKAFVPLAYFPANNELAHLKNDRGGIFDLQLLSIARIFLDNFMHLKSMWMIYGYKGAQVGLDFGADDIGGTYFDEEIVHSAGASTPKSVGKKEICDLLVRAGRKPIMVDSCYREVGNGKDL
ncbi:MAG: CofH family radical SAM protein [Lentisphaeria bacterium]